jgi:hypothetical protein
MMLSGRSQIGCLDKAQGPEFFMELFIQQARRFNDISDLVLKNLAWHNL